MGRNLRIRDQSFEIIGVMAPKGAVFGANQDEVAYVPLPTMVSRLSAAVTEIGRCFAMKPNFISTPSRRTLRLFLGCRAPP